MLTFAGQGKCLTLICYTCLTFLGFILFIFRQTTLVPKGSSFCTALLDKHEIKLYSSTRVEHFIINNNTSSDLRRCCDLNLVCLWQVSQLPNSRSFVRLGWNIQKVVQSINNVELVFSLFADTCRMSTAGECGRTSLRTGWWVYLPVPQGR